MTVIKSVAINLICKLICVLIDYDDWDRICDVTRSLSKQKLSGRDKYDIAYEVLAAQRIKLGLSMFNLSIEAAVQLLKDR